MKKLITILSIFISLRSSAGTTYYLANSGSDLNSGTSQFAPWLTISKVNATSLAPGDSVLFKAGDSFYGNIVITHSGTFANRIYWGTYGTGSKANITGFKTVSAWTSVGTNLWESTTAISTASLANQVSIGGVNRAMGRTPNASAGYAQFQTHTANTSITSSSLTGTPNWTGADVVIRFEQFIIGRDSITGQSGGTLTYTKGTGLPYLNGQDYNAHDNWGFFIQNDIRTLDQPFEWFYNRTTKKITVYYVGTPPTTQVSTIDTLVNIQLFDYNTFENLDFTGANGHTFLMVRAIGIEINNCNLSFGFSGIRGATYGGANSSLARCKNNYVHDFNDNGVIYQLEFKNDTITGNHVERIGVFPGMGGSGDGHYQGVDFDGVNSYCAFNEIDTIGFIPLGYKLSGLTMLNNYIHYHDFIKDDGGGIYAQAAGTSNLVKGNIVVDGIGAPAGTSHDANFGGDGIGAAYGIYMDDITSGSSIQYNTTANNSAGGIFLHNTNNIQVLNNTVYNSGKAGLLISDNGTGVAVRNNLKIQGNYFVESDTLYRSNYKNLCASIASRYNDIDSLGIFDFNVYARPLDDNLTFDVDSNSAGANHYLINLATWKSLLGYDAHSTKSPKSITTITDILFKYNATNSPVTIPLAVNYIDVAGLHYTGSVTIAPFSSMILIKDGTVGPFTKFSSLHCNCQLK